MSARRIARIAVVYGAALAVSALLVAWFPEHKAETFLGLAVASWPLYFLSGGLGWEP